jgi:RNase P subunit RPR2
MTSKRTGARWIAQRRADVTSGKAVAMSSKEQLASSADGKHPNCPQCQRKMTVKQVSPVLFASGVDDVVYGCEDCGTEAKRTIKRT